MSLIKSIVALVNGKLKANKNSSYSFVFLREYTNELIEVGDNEVLRLHNTILTGSSRIIATGSGRVLM